MHAGTTPLPISASIPAPPASTPAKSAAIGSAASGAGMSRSQAAVTIPSVPSEPVKRPTRSYPATLFRTGPPVVTTSPGGITASIPVTHARVVPYLNAWGPPAFVATLPPICDCSAAPGSGGNQRPLPRAIRRTSAVETPASTWIRHWSGSNARTRAIRPVPTTTPPCGTAPPANPVPPPRVVKGMPSA